MQDLHQLSHSRWRGLAPLPHRFRTVVTPLRVGAWTEALSNHPDQVFAKYLIDGIRCGFRIGYDGGDPHRSRKLAKRNMVSANQNPQVVSNYLKDEREAGRVLGPIPATDVARVGVHINRFGVIPKSNQPGKWRLIVDLSYPKGASINDGVDPDLCSLSYSSVDEAARIIARLGRGAILAKLDIQRAYRNVPVHPEDRPLLGMEWEGQVFVDAVLPFGLRSAPKIFNSLADALAWVLQQKGVCALLHYLDDFLLIGKPHSDECAVSLELTEAVCRLLGVPLAMLKREGPSCLLVFLGILIDTMAMELRLPPERLERLVRTIGQWRRKKSCTKRDLLSLIGLLQHACRVVKPGRSFLRRMIDLSTTVRELHHFVRLNKGFQSDLEWWAMFLSDWNGVSLLSTVARKPPAVIVTSDASGKWGCGAFASTGEWFQCMWPEDWKEVHITVKELMPIVIAATLWGDRWRGKTIQCRTDNAAVVAIVNSGRSKNSSLAMHLMRTLFFVMARFDIAIVAVHLPGRENEAADALSRDRLPLFFAQVPNASEAPSIVPQEVLELLILRRPDWTSRDWRNLYASIFRKGLPAQHNAHTSRGSPGI